MKPARWRLIVAASLFAGWIGYLAYLAATTRHPVVLSRPQFLISNLDVIAEVEIADGAPHLTVTKVHWPPQDAAEFEGKAITLTTDLRDCPGWQGPGTYILPLMRDAKGSYQVAPIPPSPGYEDHKRPIYPATSEAQQQLDAIPKPEAANLP